MGTETLDELYALGEMDVFFQKSKEKVEKRVHGMRLAGTDGEDVVQEALIKVYRYLPKYDSSKAKVSTYLDRIITSAIRDCLKKAGARSNLQVVNAIPLAIFEGVDDTQVTYEAGAEDLGYENAELMMDIMDHLGLTEREKEIFRLRVSGYEFKEIAQVFNISRGRMSQIWSNITTKCAVVI